MYKPLNTLEFQKRRLLEVHEVQQISEEFLQFLTKIKLKNADFLQLQLTRLPNTIQLTKEEIKKQGSKKTSTASSSNDFQGSIVYALDKRTNPLLKEVVRNGMRDEVISFLNEYFTFKIPPKKSQKENTQFEIFHFVSSLEKVALKHNHLGSKLMLLLLDY